MKKVLIGGFLSLLGSIWALGVLFVAGNNLLSGWSNPPGRFLSTVIELDLMPIFTLSIIFVIMGISIMVFEFFKKKQ